jgi:CRISPR-associated endoribonuclease Cas6/Csy4 subtype I-F
MLTHYLEYRVVDRQEAAHLIGLAVHAVHGYLARHGLDSIGIALPDARFEPPPKPEDGGKAKPGYRQHPHPGGKLRVFAPNEALLHELLAWEGLARLVEMRALLATGIRQVPTEPEGHSLWRRTRRPEKETGAYVLRNEDRYVRWLKKKGISGEPAEQRLDTRRAKLLQKLENPAPALFLRSHSKSTGCRMSLFIDRQDRQDPATGTFNRYGLSSEATVPVF